MLVLQKVGLGRGIGRKATGMKVLEKGGDVKQKGNWEGNIELRLQECCVNPRKWPTACTVVLDIMSADMANAMVIRGVPASPKRNDAR